MKIACQRVRGDVLLPQNSAPRTNNGWSVTTEEVRENSYRLKDIGTKPSFESAASLHVSSTHGVQKRRLKW